MLEFDYIGTHYTNPPEFTLDQPAGTNHYFFTLFLTDIYIKINETMHFYQSGTVLLYPPEVPQYYHNPTNGFSNDWFQFSGRNAQSFLDSIAFPCNIPFSIKNPKELHQKFQQIEGEFFSQNTHHEQMMNLLAKEIFIQLAREYHSNTAENENTLMEERFRQARSTILSHLDQDWTIEDMAALLDLSPSRFSHLYSSIFHISPKKNLMMERINTARFLIQSQNYSVTEAAARVGYDNIYHFSKQFKLVTGKAPSEYF